jgi:hypothetical protein
MFWSDRQACVARPTWRGQPGHFEYLPVPSSAANGPRKSGLPTAIPFRGRQDWPKELRRIRMGQEPVGSCDHIGVAGRRGGFDTIAALLPKVRCCALLLRDPGLDHRGRVVGELMGTDEDPGRGENVRHQRSDFVSVWYDFRHINNCRIIIVKGSGGLQRLSSR